MAVDILIANNNIVSNLVAQDASFLPKLWAKSVEIGEAEENFLMQMEAPGEDSIIVTENDTNKDAGESIHFRTLEDFYGEGVQGDTLINGNGEEIVNGGYDLTVDYFRNMAERTQRLETKSALTEELRKNVPLMLGRWMGRKYTDQAFMTWRALGGSTNYAFTNGKGSRELLRSGDIIQMDDVTINGQILKNQGAMTPRIGELKGEAIKRYVVLALGEGLTNLQTSSDYKQAQREAGLRGDENLIFKGEFYPITGHIIKPYNPIDHAGRGPIGSALMAKAKLGGAIATGAGVVTILGGGRTDFGSNPLPMYFKHFSEYAYPFNPSNILTPPGLTRYLMIVNPPNASVDPGKCGFYSYNVNNGNAITITGRLGPTVNNTGGNVQNTTIGNVTWETGAWLTNTSGFAGCTQQHPVGSIILECNSYGVPFQKFIILGAKSMKRGYGKYRNRRSEQLYEGGFVMQTYITSVFGQSLVLRSDGLAPGYVMVEAAVRPAGLNIPYVS
jgi:hypothetical protein